MDTDDAERDGYSFPLTDQASPVEDAYALVIRGWQSNVMAYMDGF